MESEREVLYLDLLRPRNQNDVVSLHEQPRERDLPPGRTAVFLANGFQTVCEFEDVGEFCGAEADWLAC
jgi:hypothetical protein